MADSINNPPEPSLPEDTSWYHREFVRFRTGEYQVLPWFPVWDYHDTHNYELDENGCYDYGRPLIPPRQTFGASYNRDLFNRIGPHFAHYSKNQPGMVAFTMSNAHGLADRQTVMKPGRYLAKYYPEMSPQDVANFAGMISAMAKLDGVRFAKTREEIRTVYLNGPNSCMSHDVDDYDCSPIHPVEVYAGPDTQIAYMLGHTEDNVTARCVVRLGDDGKPVSHGRIYGDEPRMKAALAELGIEASSQVLRGARLLKLQCEDDSSNYAMPYLDGYYTYVYPDGEYFRVCNSEGARQNAATCADNTGGTVYARDRIDCEECGDTVPEDETTSIDGYCVCQHCLDNNYVYSSITHGYLRTDDAVEARYQVYTGRTRSDYIPADWVDDGSSDYHTCAHDGEVYEGTIMSEVTTDRDGDTVMVADCNLEDYGAVEVDGTYYDTSLVEEDEHGDYVLKADREGRDDDERQDELDLAA